jgi:hypothetical protein
LTIKVNNHNWLTFVLIIVSLKFLLFCIDPLPMFFLGDSQVYISTALKDNIPPDRSFIYGFIIRLIAVPTHSLNSLIGFQILTSTLNVIILSYVLIKLFSVAPRVAFIVGFLCAIEPLQLLYERYIMTESLSLFVFDIYMVLIFYYLREPRLVVLIVVQIIGTILISFRLSFLPIIYINTFILPLLVIPVLNRRYSIKIISFKELWTKSLTHRAIIKTIALHLIVSIVITYALHAGYKSLNGMLADRPPAYQYESGFFLLASLSPVIKPVDFPYPALYNDVFGKLDYELRDRQNRGPQRWHPGGIVHCIRTVFPSYMQAEQVARETALNALKRDPIGIATLTVMGFSDYWNTDLLDWGLSFDRGNVLIPDDMLADVSTHFNLSANQLPFIRTFTNVYYFSARFWYLFLLCIPFLSIVAFFFCNNDTKPSVLIIFLTSSVIVVIACLLIERPTVRYLHALGWLSFFIFGLLIDNILKKGTTKGY